MRGIGGSVEEDEREAEEGERESEEYEREAEEGEESSGVEEARGAEKRRNESSRW